MTLAEDELHRSTPQTGSVELIKTIGYFCPFFPEELAVAAGLLPIRLETGDEQFAYIDSVCLMCHAEGIEPSEASFNIPVFKLEMPLSDRYRRSPNFEKAFGHQLRHLRKQLASLSGRYITYLNDFRAITLYNQIREILRRLYEYPIANSSPIEWLEVFELTRAGARTDRHEFLKQLQQVEKSLILKKTSGVPVDSRIRLMITATSLHKIEALNEIVNAAGGNIVADYSCQAGMSLRKRVPVFGLVERPIETLIERCLFNAPCHGSGDNPARIDRMIRLARNFQIQGLIYYNPLNRPELVEDFNFVDDAFYRILAVPAFLVNGTEFKSDGTQGRLKEFIDVIGGRV